VPIDALSTAGVSGVSSTGQVSRIVAVASPLYDARTVLSTVTGTVNVLVFGSHTPFPTVIPSGRSCMVIVGFSQVHSTCTTAISLLEFAGTLIGSRTVTCLSLVSLHPPHAERTALATSPPIIPAFDLCFCAESGVLIPPSGVERIYEND